MEQLAEFDHRSADFNPAGAVTVLKIEDANVSESKRRAIQGDTVAGESAKKSD